MLALQRWWEDTYLPELAERRETSAVPTLDDAKLPRVAGGETKNGEHTALDVRREFSRASHRPASSSSLRLHWGVWGERVYRVYF